MNISKERAKELIELVQQTEIAAVFEALKAAGVSGDKDFCRVGFRAYNRPSRQSNRLGLRIVAPAGRKNQ